MGAGHGGSSGRYDRLKEQAFEYAWLMSQVGIDEVASSLAPTPPPLAPLVCYDLLGALLRCKVLARAFSADSSDFKTGSEARQSPPVLKRLLAYFGPSRLSCCGGGNRLADHSISSSDAAACVEAAGARRPRVAAIVREMFELMYAANGVGLAANQVDLPYRLFVINLKADPRAKEEEHVFINPVITAAREQPKAKRAA